ncbi:hypothetical protein VKT23_014369 [Stygiomarasmius scandens]|uniref:Prolyl 4-hydroxylase alpha subunit Fe(2+) 2OG dioxygenase domain-containing protein n=1 Tax=Marasmiellus scandens TaxID=2682957 RepID=A0ABR1J0G3_9AGAR
MKLFSSSTPAVWERPNLDVSLCLALLGAAETAERPSLERLTRSGLRYAPWTASSVLESQRDGTPLQCPRAFDLPTALKEEETRRETEGDWDAGLDLEDETGERDVPVFETTNLPKAPLDPCIKPTPVSPKPPPSAARSRAGPIRSKTEKKAFLRAQTHAKKKEARRVKRCNASPWTTNDPVPLKEVARQRVAESKPLPAPSCTIEALPVGSTGWTGPPEKRTRRQPELRESEMTLYNWDGRSCSPVVDSTGRVVGVLGGRPRGENWSDLMSTAAGAIATTAKELAFTVKQTDNGRGDFPAVAVGIAHGGGRKHPGNVRQRDAASLTRLSGLVAMQCFQSIVGFANCLFQAYAPDIYLYYLECMRQLKSRNPHLRWHFGDSAFASCTVNFRPATVSRPHKDSANLSFGWCAITALGSFDPDKGGHLILWELGLIIRFPPGSTILIPSALITHSNTPIQDGETRYSFVQYSASGLFRWVYNGFKSDIDFEASATPAQRAKCDEDRQNRWKNGVEMFSKWKCM